MEFLRYPSLSKIGNVEVENIEVGTCHIMPKIDGTNASMWYEFAGNRFCFGSRNRELSLDNDNAGFMNHMISQGGEYYYHYLFNNPNHILYGEWLVPHSLKDYRDDAWKKFYVFDVYDTETEEFIPYDIYVHDFKTNYPGIIYIPVFKVMKNPTVEDLYFQAKEIKYLLKDPTCIGEGVVIKNYSWVNRNRRQTWAKLITTEFKDKHVAEMGGSESGGVCNEEKIVDHCVTEALVRKEHAKILVRNNGWSSKDIPTLLFNVFYCLFHEELWDALKLINHGSVNFKALKTFTILKIKKTMPELF